MLVCLYTKTTSVVSLRLKAHFYFSWKLEQLEGNYGLLVTRSIDQSINQLINQPINQSTNKSMGNITNLVNEFAHPPAGLDTPDVYVHLRHSGPAGNNRLRLSIDLHPPSQQLCRWHRLKSNIYLENLIVTVHLPICLNGLLND